MQQTLLYQNRVSKCDILCVFIQVVVLWVGTNNHGHTPEQICGGIMAIISVIHQKLPRAHTLVLVSYLSSYLCHSIV